MLTRVRLENFTAFSSLDWQPGPGVNLLIGANGTGKTHLLKVMYAACDITRTGTRFDEKLVRIFLPHKKILGRLVRRRQGRERCFIEIQRTTTSIQVSLRATFSTKSRKARMEGEDSWYAARVKAVYIPVKEMLSNAPGFRSLYAQREIHFSEVYADILDRAYLPPIRGRPEKRRENLLDKIRRIIQGRVIIEDEEFFLMDKGKKLEFSLLAEGMRKLGLLWLLIQNGTLLEGSILFWDEPEANLHPRLMGPLVDVLLELQRMGVQIFLATHDYVILKEFDLRKRSEDRVLFHAFYFDEEQQIRSSSTEEYREIHPNAIAETFSDMYEREIDRMMATHSHESA